MNQPLSRWQMFSHTDPARAAFVGLSGRGSVLDESAFRIAQQTIAQAADAAVDGHHLVSRPRREERFVAVKKGWEGMFGHA